MGKAEIGKSASGNPTRDFGKTRRPAERSPAMAGLREIEGVSRGAMLRAPSPDKSAGYLQAQVIDFTLNPA